MMNLLITHQNYRGGRAMAKIKITPIREATEQELHSLAKWTIGISHLNLKGARAFFPTDSIERIKKHRKSVFEAVRDEFLRERAIKLITTTEGDIKLLHTNWLTFELKEIDRLYDTPFISDSEKVELGKYRDYVNAQLKQEGLNYSQQAVIAAYEGDIIQRSHPLYNKWLKYNSRPRRIETEDPRVTIKQIRNRIALFESILPYLSDKAQKTATEEVSTLKAFLGEKS